MERRRDTKKAHKSQNQGFIDWSLAVVGEGRETGERGKGRLLIFFSFSWSPLLSGPRSTERVGGSVPPFTQESLWMPVSSVAIRPEVTGPRFQFRLCYQVAMPFEAKTQHKSLQALQLDMSFHLYSTILTKTVAWASCFPSLCLSFLIYQVSIRGRIAMTK